MFERPKTIEPRKKRSFKKAGALVSLVATLATPAIAQARPEVSPNRATVGAAEVKLKNPSEQPGAKIEVSKKTQELSRDSTVQIGVEHAGGSFSYRCTGVKSGRDRVRTSAHCVDETTGAPIGLIDVGLPAADFIKVAEAKGLRYLIFDPKVVLKSSDPNIAERAAQPIAKAVGASVARLADEMEFKVEPVEPNLVDQRLKTTRSFDQIPVLAPIDRGLSREKPKLGQKVVLSAVPASPGKSPYENPDILLTQTGVYLGDFTEYSPTAGTRHFEAVGLTAKETGGLVIGAEGASGSEFAADINGKVYASGSMDSEYSRDITWRDAANYPGSSPKEILTSKKKFWDDYSRALGGVNLKPYIELLIYSQNVISGNHSTIHDIENGFGNYLDPNSFKPAG